MSTLSHVPIVDVGTLEQQLLASQDQLLNALPETVRELAKTLPSFDSLLKPGQHYGLDLTIPRRIEIVPPRMITGFVNFLQSR